MGSKEHLKWTRAEDMPADEAEGVRRLTAEDISVVFQPIVSIATGRTFAHEALVRCKVAEYASPLVLFQKAAAERACGRLGRLIRDNAFKTSGDVALFVNLHPEELNSRWIVRPDDPIGFHSKPVYLEITESAAFTHFELCLGVLKELLRRTHALLVIDDFGAGYSNLERLADLEPAVVKLDLALIRDLHRHKRKQTVVRHVVNLCKELGASVVAEGVETMDELVCVRDLGVDYAQGYLLARPAAPPPQHAWPLEVRVPDPPLRQSLSAPQRHSLSAAQRQSVSAPSGSQRHALSASSAPRVGSKAPASRRSNTPSRRSTKPPPR